jgi:hypothetical protein
MDKLRVVIHMEAFVVAGGNHHLAILDKDVPIGILGVPISYGENLGGAGGLATTEMDQNRQLLAEEADLGQIPLDGIRTKAIVVGVQEVLLEQAIGTKAAKEPLISSYGPSGAGVVQEAPASLSLRRIVGQGGPGHSGSFNS